MASLIINLENEMFLLNAIRQAMKDERFNSVDLVKNMVLWYYRIIGIRYCGIWYYGTMVLWYWGGTITVSSLKCTRIRTQYPLPNHPVANI